MNYINRFLQITLLLANAMLISVIACKPSFPTYLQALNPTDQVFDFEELEYHYQVANRTEDVPSKGNLNNLRQTFFQLYFSYIRYCGR